MHGSEWSGAVHGGGFDAGFLSPSGAAVVFGVVGLGFIFPSD